MLLFLLKLTGDRGDSSKQVGEPIKSRQNCYLIKLHTYINQLGGFIWPCSFGVNHDTTVAVVAETDSTGDRGRVQGINQSSAKEGMQQIKRCNASADGLLVLANHTFVCYMAAVAGRKVGEDEWRGDTPTFDEES